MIRKITTTPKKKSTFLLKAGLSVIFFLQIQLPDAAVISTAKEEAQILSNAHKPLPCDVVAYQKPAAPKHTVALAVK